MKFTWDYIMPPQEGDLPIVEEDGSRYSCILVEQDGRNRVRFGELYSSCTKDDETSRYYWRRMEAKARLIKAAPEMYEMLSELATCGAIVNSHYTARIKALLAKVRGGG